MPNRRFLQSNQRCIRFRRISQLHSRIHEQKNLFMLLLTTLIINQGFNTKTKLQKLAEGNVIPEDSKTNNKDNNTYDNKNKKDETTPRETG